jgi:hypothetical protein
MSVLIGTSPLGLAMIKHKNKIIAGKGLGMGAKNINGEPRSTVTKQEAVTVKQQVSQTQKVSDWGTLNQ